MFRFICFSQDFYVLIAYIQDIFLDGKKIKSHTYVIVHKANMTNEIIGNNWKPKEKYLKKGAAIKFWNVKQRISVLSTWEFRQQMGPRLIRSVVNPKGLPNEINVICIPHLDCRILQDSMRRRLVVNSQKALTNWSLVNSSYLASSGSWYGNWLRVFCLFMFFIEYLQSYTKFQVIRT